MKKLCIVINGKGGAGKDTLCDFAAKAFPTVNVSSITPIKKIAAENGWQGEKTPEARRFLAELKRVFTEYNDLTTRYAISEYESFLSDPEKQLFFVHIREGEQIDRFLKQARAINGCKCITLLITSQRCEQSYGNTSDDLVENYNYDHVFANDGTLAEAEAAFIPFLSELIQNA